MIFLLAQNHKKTNFLIVSKFYFTKHISRKILVKILWQNYLKIKKNIK